MTGGARSSSARRSIVILSTATLLVIVAPTAAAGGGWWSTPDVESDVLAIGEETTASTTTLFADPDELADARSGDRTYYAYLVRGIDEDLLAEAMGQADPERWWRTPDEALLLGELVFDRWDQNLALASITFTVPDVEPGSWDLMFCDLGCHEPLADVIPLRDVVVSDLATARLAAEAASLRPLVVEQADRVYARVQDVAERGAEMHDELATVQRQMTRLQSSVGELDGVVSSLDRRLTAPEEPARSSWLGDLGWLVAGVTLAIVWSRRRREDSDDEPRILDHVPVDSSNGTDERNDDELPELVPLG